MTINISGENIDTIIKDNGHSIKILPRRRQNLAWGIILLGLGYAIISYATVGELFRYSLGGFFSSFGLYSLYISIFPDILVLRYEEQYYDLTCGISRSHRTGNFSNFEKLHALPTFIESGDEITSKTWGLYINWNDGTQKKIGNFSDENEYHTITKYLTEKLNINCHEDKPNIISGHAGP